LKNILPDNESSKFIVITSIYPPTEAVRQFAERKDWQLVVAGDTKTPSDWHYPDVKYLSPDEQKQMSWQFVQELPWKTYARKMAAYAYAIENGAQIIADTDDDNIPYEEWAKQIEFSGQFDLLQHSGFVNLYAYFTEEHVWPRGFPLNRILDHTKPATLPGNSDALNVGIWQFLADEDPDVDAIYRLTNNKPIYFKKRAPIVLSLGTYSPFNSQNTFFRRETFPLLYLPAFVNFRFTDILRGLVAQPILWAAGYTLGFGHATVIQKRNPHDYLTDFESEIPCFLYPEMIVELVSNAISPEQSIPANMAAAYEALFKANIVTEKELKLLHSWLELFN
jgi:hypothetical protein